MTKFILFSISFIITSTSLSPLLSQPPPEDKVVDPETGFVYYERYYNLDLFKEDYGIESFEKGPQNYVRDCFLGGRFIIDDQKFDAPPPKPTFEFKLGTSLWNKATFLYFNQIIQQFNVSPADNLASLIQNYSTEDDLKNYITSLNSSLQYMRDFFNAISSTDNGLEIERSATQEEFYSIYSGINKGYLVNKYGDLSTQEVVALQNLAAVKVDNQYQKASKALFKVNVYFSDYKNNPLELTKDIIRAQREIKRIISVFKEQYLPVFDYYYYPHDALYDSPKTLFVEYKKILPLLNNKKVSHI